MAEKSRFKKFWDFDYFILPTIIKVLMVVWIIICPIAAIIMRAQGGNIWEGLLTLILWPIAVRIYAEMFILLFKIEENTHKN